MRLSCARVNHVLIIFLFCYIWMNWFGTDAEQIREMLLRQWCYYWNNWFPVPSKAKLYIYCTKIEFGVFITMLNAASFPLWRMLENFPSRKSLHRPVRQQRRSVCDSILDFTLPNSLASVMEAVFLHLGWLLYLWLHGVLMWKVKQCRIMAAVLPATNKTNF